MELGLPGQIEQEMCINFAHLYISATDGVKINEQNKSIAIGPLYLQTEFETPAESYDGFIPCGVSDVAIRARSKCKTPKSILP